MKWLQHSRDASSSGGSRIVNLPTGDPRQRQANIVARSHLDFIGAILAEFPELRDDMGEFAGLPHLQLGEFAAFTQAAKGRGDLTTYERCLKLVDRIFAQADADLAGALRVSYLEHLEFEGSRGPAAWQLVPARLQAAWNQVAAENRRLMALPQRRAEPKPPRGKRKGKTDDPRRNRGRR
jgi:hypothetical protein